ncbi:hypothetical protein O5629_28375, partial [Escherichia coli]|nr:hypothetical protein [Escherichia coli]
DIMKPQYECTNNHQRKLYADTDVMDQAVQAVVMVVMGALVLAYFIDLAHHAWMPSTSTRFATSSIGLDMGFEPLQV